MTRSPRFHSLSLKAPAPTGSLPNSAAFAVTTFCGTTEAANMASVERKGAEGSLKVTTTVLSSGASIVWATLYMLPMTESFWSRSRSRLNFTSWAVSGLPSENLSPSRSLKV